MGWCPVLRWALIFGVLGAARMVFLVGSVLLEVFFAGGEGFLWEFSAPFGRAGLRVFSQVASLSYFLGLSPFGSCFSLFLRNST